VQVPGRLQERRETRKCCVATLVPSGGRWSIISRASGHPMPAPTHLRVMRQKSEIFRYRLVIHHWRSALLWIFESKSHPTRRVSGFFCAELTIVGPPPPLQTHGTRKRSIRPVWKFSGHEAGANQTIHLSDGRQNTRQAKRSASLGYSFGIPKELGTSSAAP
jgi:hypothetical protein